MAKTFSMNADGLNFDELISALFFNAATEKEDRSVIEYFQSNGLLIPVVNNTGWAMLPPIQIKGVITTYTFKFIEHPFFISDFQEGELCVITDKTETAEYVLDMEIKLSYSDEAVRNSVSANIQSLLKERSDDTYNISGKSHPNAYTRFSNKKNNEDITIYSKKKGDSFLLLIDINRFN